MNKFLNIYTRNMEKLRVKYTMNPQELGNYLFIPSDTFNGERPGYVYKNGPTGLGYYLNRAPIPHPDISLLPNIKFDPVQRTTVRYVPRDEIPVEQHPYITFLDLPKLPDREPPTDTLAMFMGCHGVRMTTLQPNIDGVTISKFNHSGYCGITHGVTSKKRSMSSAQNLVYGWEYLPRPTQEEWFVSEYCNMHPNDGLDMDNTCSNFYVNPPNGWVCKVYGTKQDPQTCLAVAYKNKVIDLLHCSEDELYDFIDIKLADPSMLGDLNFILDVPDKRRITTEQLFKLIELFKLKGINKVHIYDMSCNENDNTTQPTDVGYGGKSKRRKRKHRKSKKLK
jgi:hypothetical protein